MAIIFAGLDSGQIATPGSLFVTNQFLPTANRKVLAFVGNNKATTPGTCSVPTIGGGITNWAQVGTVSTTLSRLTAFIGNTASPVLQEMDMNFGADVEIGVTWAVLEIGGVLGVAVGSPVTGTGTGTSASTTITPTGPDNAIVSAIYRVSTTGLTVESGWTEHVQITQTGTRRFSDIYRPNTQDVTPSWTWSGSQEFVVLTTELNMAALTGAEASALSAAVRRRRRRHNRF